MRMVRCGLSAMLLGLVLLATGCKEVTEAPTGLAYSSNPATYTTGTAIPANSPTHTGGSIASYAVSPALPSGLNLDASSGVISGTPTLAVAVATYTVTGTNSSGSTTASLSITVNDPIVLKITTQPTDQSVVVGQTATFTVVASGNGTLSYQWLEGGVAITGATSASYTTPATVLGDSGSSFTVQVSDTAGGNVTSNAATLTVNPASGPGTFTATTGSMANARAFHTATLLTNGKVLIVGGYNGVSLSSAELFDPVNGTFEATGPLATPRDHHTATLLGNGKVLIAGGVNFTSATTTAELYDPVAGTFSATGSLGKARSDHSATLLPDGNVLIVAGRDSTSYVATAELYNPTNGGNFTATSNAPLTTRATHSATLLSTGEVLIAGGFRGSNLATAELYHPVAGTFTATNSLITARSYQTATLLSNGKVLIAGGAATTLTELYDPSGAGAFASSGNLVTARDHWHAAALLPTGKVLIMGGVGTGTPAPLLSVAELYDPATGTFSATGPMTTIREAHTATTLQSGKILVAGGVGAGYLASAELYF